MLQIHCSENAVLYCFNLKDTGNYSKVQTSTCHFSLKVSWSPLFNLHVCALCVFSVCSMKKRIIALWEMLHYSAKFLLVPSDPTWISDLFPREQKTQRYVIYSRSYWKGRESKRLSFYSVLMAWSSIETENLAVVIGIHHNSIIGERMKHWGW